MYNSDAHGANKRATCAHAAAQDALDRALDRMLPRDG
jgi:hypothetical protein